MSTPTQSPLHSNNPSCGAALFRHSSAAEDERLSLIEDEQDDYAKTRIEAFGIRSDWHCLEVGAGKGSMAYWLAGRCPTGRVVATDLETSLLNNGGRPNLEILTHNVSTDDFPLSSFHLIHARGVLTHVQDPDHVCERMVSWLRPSGWLLVAEPASFPIDSSPHSLMRKVGVASAIVMREIVGADVNWARSFPRPLLRAGLSYVDAECKLHIMRGGSREARMFELMLAQLSTQLIATGLISKEDLTELRNNLHDPSFFDFPPAVVRAWGRRL